MPKSPGKKGAKSKTDDEFELDEDFKEFDLYNDKGDFDDNDDDDF